MIALSGLDAARTQMAVSLAFHIVFASIGVGLPVLMLIAEYQANRHHDGVWKNLARRWSKAFGVLFAVGAVSGTVLSFSLGIFWPGLTGRFGAVIGLPFALEAFAFFLEAIFVGIYLYGWDRLSPWKHWACGIPVAISGAASAWFVVTANAWMQSPVGFTLTAAGDLRNADPIGAMFNPATPIMTTHMMIAAYMATSFAVASVYAVGMLRGRTDSLHTRGLALGLAVGLALAPIQVVVGDAAARFVADHQPVKLAAMEGQWKTTSDAPLRIGGIPFPSQERTRFALEIPGGLSWLAFGSTGATVRGLLSVPVSDRPNPVLVHLSFQLMVGCAFFLVFLGIWAALARLRRRRFPQGRWFLRGAALAGPAAFAAVEAGWIVTEVGRQPWIVQGVLRTADASTTRPGIGIDLAVTLCVYALLGATTIYLMLRLAKTNRGSIQT